MLNFQGVFVPVHWLNKKHSPTLCLVFFPTVGLPANFREKGGVSIFGSDTPWKFNLLGRGNFSGASCETVKLGEGNNKIPTRKKKTWNLKMHKHVSFPGSK